MRFKIREATEALIIQKVATEGKSLRVLEREAYLSGKFGVDFHYLVMEDGLVEPGREPATVAGYEIDPTRRALVVIVEGDPEMPLTDAQEVALGYLKESILATYPNIPIERRS